jgi:membrane-bound serine protease (ClpP class)
MGNKLRLARIALYMGLVCAGLVAPLHASAQDADPGGAFILEIDGAIDPNRAKFLKRGLKRSQDEGGDFVIIVIDTPGGLVSSMQDMVQSIFASKIPVITFVAPQGARAASAGTFITAAGHVAVMAPSTNIGAATPIGGGGEDLPETLASKALNDAAAEIRGIAEVRGRNIEKLEETVREASSFTSQEALDLNMIDLIANDLPDLLAKLDGRVVSLDRGDVTLHTEGIVCGKPRVMCTSVSPTFVENFLSVIADPNISALLLSLGGLALFIEILNPGLIFPGVFGAIALTLAFVALGNLPVNYAGVGLILFALVLLFFELQVGGAGILGVGALVAFVLGALFLFSPFAADPPSISGPRIKVSPWFIGGFGGSMAAVVTGVLWLAWRGKNRTPETVANVVVGRTGRVTSALNPIGSVRIQGNDWSAEEENSLNVAAGERVEVLSVDGLTLTVRKVPKLLPQGKGRPAFR